jgi:TldD protein
MIQRRDFVKAGASVAGGLVLTQRVLGAHGLWVPGTPNRARPGKAEIDSVLKDLLLDAIDAATTAGAQYADARAELLLRQSVSTREDHVQSVGESTSEGIGVRAFVDGSWGFAATPEMTREAIVRTAQTATAVAKANAAVQRAPSELAPVDAFGDVTWTAPHEVDPFSVSVEEKADLFLRLNEVALAQEGVQFVSSGITCYRTDKTLATSEDTVAAQRFMRVGPYMTITAVSADRSRFQPRGSGQPGSHRRMPAVSFLAMKIQFGRRLAGGSFQPEKADVLQERRHDQEF